MVKKLFIRNKFFLPLLVVPIILSLIGLIFVFESSSLRSINEFGDSFHYLRLQTLWFFLAIAALTFFTFLDYRKLYFFSFITILLTIFLLVIVLIPGIGSQAGGARRWIDFGIINIQPTELAKFSVIIYLASWFINKEKKRFVSFIFLVSLLIFLIILQPDMGTAIIIFLISLVMYYFAGMSFVDLLVLFPFSGAAFYLFVKLSPYRLKRILAYFNPSLDPQGISYHINQILISLTNGGLIGQGFGASRQKYLFLPEAHTDSIFAIIAEEYGFIGGALLIFLYFIFIYKIYHLIRLAPDKLSRLIGCGVFAFFNLQIIVNLAAMSGLFPLTGVSLPFISYGGSNLLISYSLIGILLNIEKRVKV